MRQETRSGWALGGMIFAATMMLVIGAFQIFMGIAAIAKDQFFVLNDGYAYNMDTTAWGWIHLILGAIILLAGFFLYSGAMWARALGIALAVLSAVSNFFFIPYYPIWSLVIIALDVFVIWALATVDRRGVRMMDDSDAGMDAAMPPSGAHRAGAGAGAAAGSGDRWSSSNPAGYASERASDVKPAPAPTEQQAPRTQ